MTHDEILTVIRALRDHANVIRSLAGYATPEVKTLLTLARKLRARV